MLYGPNKAFDCKACFLTNYPKRIHYCYNFNFSKANPFPDFLSSCVKHNKFFKFSDVTEDIAPNVTKLNNVCFFNRQSQNMKKNKMEIRGWIRMHNVLFARKSLFPARSISPSVYFLC
jgi:hypothetical protein